MDKFWHWQGASGAWYVHIILPFEVPEGWTAGANYVAVRRDLWSNTCSAIYIGETDELGRRWREHRADGLFDRAAYLGANELHIHLLGDTKRQRLDIETDLRNGHAAALNRQPSNAFGALYGLGAAALAGGHVPSAFGGLSALNAIMPPQPSALSGSGLLPQPTHVNGLLAALSRR